MDSNVLFLKYEDCHRVSAWGGASRAGRVLAWVPQGRVLRGGYLGGVS